MSKSADQRTGSRPLLSMEAALCLLLSCAIAATLEAQTEWKAVRGRTFNTESSDRPPIHLWPTTMTLGPDGNLYIGDRQGTNAIFVYSIEGELVRQIGRHGRGPGEFDELSCLGFRGDTLWAYDANLKRVTLFDLKGKRIAEEPKGASPRNEHRIRSQMGVRGYMADGSLILWAMTSSAPGLWDGEQVIRVVSYRHFSDTAVVMDSTPVLSEPGKREIILGAASIISGPSPLKTRASVSKTGLGWVVATPILGKGYRIEFTRTTDPPLRREVTDKPRKMPPGALEAWVTRWVNHASNTGDTKAKYRTALERGVADIEYLSPVTGLLYGVDGTVWVRRDWLDIDESKPGQTVRWDLLDQTGKVIAYLSLPAIAQLAIATRSRVWVIEENQDGVRELVRYEIAAR
jgi:hypothetical protein